MTNGPFTFTVQHVFYIKPPVDRVVVLGVVDQGAVRPGDALVIEGNGRAMRATVEAIVALNMEEIPSAESGDQVALRFAGVPAEEINPGDRIAIDDGVIAMTDGVASAVCHRVELMAELERSPVVDIVGVVHPMGCSASKPGGRQHWTLSFTLVAWRDAGGLVQDRDLAMEKPVNYSEIDAFQHLINPFEVIKVRARVAETNSFGAPHGLLVEVLATDIRDDAELCARVQELQNPVTFDDERLGTFTLDRAVNWYECRTNWGATPVSLTLSPDANEGTEALLASAHALFSSQVEWDQRIRDFAVAKLLDIKNVHWRREGEQEVSADQFKSKMTLKSIGLLADGSFEFVYQDGELFWGHSILVSGNLAEGPTDADIPG